MRGRALSVPWLVVHPQEIHHQRGLVAGDPGVVAGSEQRHVAWLSRGFPTALPLLAAMPDPGPGPTRNPLGKASGHADLTIPIQPIGRSAALANIVPMKAPARPSASPIEHSNSSGGASPASLAGDRSIAVFSLGLDISPLRPRQRYVVRALLQRMAAKSSPTPPEPRT